MRLHCLGINHRSADVSIREKLAFDEDLFKRYWERISQYAHIHEAVVLSTCNRVEIYAAASQPSFDILIENLLSLMDIDLKNAEQLFYRLVDEQVVSHLFRVAAGLDSQVLGEAQILGQVTEAYEQSLAAGSCKKVLSKIFQMAIRTGKRVRTETSIGRNSTSVSSLAALVAEENIADISTAQITLLGAGEMVELAVEALKKRGVQHFFVVNRTINNACELAARWDGQAGTLDSLNGVLENTDILLTSTSAPHTLIYKDMIAEAMQTRPDRPMVIIDIAVPRDVSPDVQEVPNVLLYDIDQLNKGVEQALAQRSLEVPAVERILKEEYLTFKEFWSTLKVVPVIARIRRQADLIRQQELEKTLRHMPELDEASHEQLEALTRSIVKKIMHAPTVRLKQEASGPEAEKYAQAAQSLFGLGTNDNGNSNQAQIEHQDE